MVAKGLYSAVSGAAVGSVVGLVGDYVNHKFPQTDAQNNPLKPSDKDYSYFMDRSILVNGGVAAASLVGMFLVPRKAKMRDMWQTGLATMATVTALKAAMRAFRIYQEKDGVTGNEWANYSKMRMTSQYYQMPSGVGYHAYANQASLPNPVIEDVLYNVK